MKKITVQTMVSSPIEQVWSCWTQPDHIKQWAFASTDWHVPHAENNLKVGGKFLTRMEAKEGGEGFDFEGEYTNINDHKLIEYKMSDGRMVSVTFNETNEGVEMIETFDPETENPLEMQKAGWQAILENFRTYVESNSSLGS